MGKRTYIIEECARYYVKATSERQAEKQVLDALNLCDAPIDCEVVARDVEVDPENRAIERPAMPRWDYQIRIEGPSEVGNGEQLIVCETYRTKAAAVKAWPKVLRTFRREYAIGEDDVYYAELVAVIRAEALEAS